jgi:hypothetical protein
MKWIEILTIEDLPDEGVYVLVKFDDDYVGISAILDEEWVIVGRNKHPIYKNNEKLFTSCDPHSWMPLPV